MLNEQYGQRNFILLSKPHYTPGFLYGVKKVKVCQTTKLLGVTFDSKRTFLEQVGYVCSRLTGNIYGMRVLKRLSMNGK